MARIPQQDIERLKREVSLQRLVEAKGIALKKHGAADLIGRCPFHDDKTPSLVVSPKKNLWHCLGACNTGGSVIDWVMKTEGVSFRHAAEILRNDTGLSLDPPLAASTEPATRLPAPIQINADDHELVEQVVDFYHATFNESPEAQAYLEQRGLTHPELVERFRIGFANRTLGYRIPKKRATGGSEARGRLEEIGIYRPSGHEHFNGSIIVPITDPTGQVVEVYGRKITRGLRKGTPLHLYLPGPHRGVFNWEGLTDSQDVILCESIIDAMTFWCAGFRNVTCTYGTSGFTEDHLEVFRAAHIRRVLIAFDRDDAGNLAADKLAERLAREGFEAFRVQFPKGMDANEYALAMKPADKALDLVLRKAVWIAGAARAPELTAEPVLETAEPVLEDDAPAPEAEAVVEAPAPPAPEAKAPASPKAATEAPRPTPLTGPADSATAPHISPPPGGVMPKAPPVDIEQRDHEVILRFGPRHLRVRGLSKNKSYDVLKVNLLIRQDDRFFVDNLDIYHARQRAAFIKQAAQELDLAEDVLKKDLAHALRALEGLQDEAMKAATKPKTPDVVLTQDEREEAMALLTAPNLLEQILIDFDALGVVGEHTNKLAGYLASTSRKLDKPLAVIVQSSSAAGKSSLMEAILAVMPDEDRIKYSAMTGQSLYYLGETDLKHKILAIVEEEGAERAAYALKLLQSEGELTIASTGKDPQTGELRTKDYRVEGPVMIFLTTTALDIDEELLNRCLVLTVDEGAEQTQAIHDTQRRSRTLQGLLSRARRDDLIKKHRNAQRLIERLPVVNPYAEHLTFSCQRTRTRRDHMKYLTLIEAVALLHQHQRPHKTATAGAATVRYIEVTPMDIEIANSLAHQLLGRTLDELPPQTRRVLEGLIEMVKKDCTEQAVDVTEYRFSRRRAREHLQCSDTQLRLHIGRLVELEYLIVHRGQRGLSFVYELAYTPTMGQTAFLPGLIEPSTLPAPTAPTTPTSRGRTPASRVSEPTSRAEDPRESANGEPTRGVAGTSRGHETSPTPASPAPNRRNEAPSPRTHSNGHHQNALAVVP